VKHEAKRTLTSEAASRVDALPALTNVAHRLTFVYIYTQFTTPFSAFYTSIKYNTIIPDSKLD